MGIQTEGIKVKANTKVVGCLYSIGAISMTRDKTEKKCLTDGTIINIIDTIKTGDLDIGVSYDPTDTEGAQELETVFNSGAEFTFEIELSDTAGTNGTTFTWDGAVVTKFEVNPDDDGEAGASFTVAPGGKPTVTAAA